MGDGGDKSLMRSLGEFFGHVKNGIRKELPAEGQRQEVRRTVETERRGDVVLRRTTIDEVELRRPPPEES